MNEEVLLFWLIHLFIGIVLPALAYFGCCKGEDEQAQKKAQALQHTQSLHHSKT